MACEIVGVSIIGANSAGLLLDQISFTQNSVTIDPGSNILAGEFEVLIEGVHTEAVSEPFTLSLFGLGLFSLGFTRRRMRNL
jgi:hypothetical protein